MWKVTELSKDLDRSSQEKSQNPADVRFDAERDLQQVRGAQEEMTKSENMIKNQIYLKQR